MGVVMENLFSSSVHRNSFGDIKETPRGVEKQLECENGSNQNRVTQANKKARSELLLFLMALWIHPSFCHRHV